MQIRVGKYEIKSDTLNIMLYEERKKKAKDGEEGKTVMAFLGYHTSLEAAFKQLVTHKICASDAQSLNELRAEVQELR